MNDTMKKNEKENKMNTQTFKKAAAILASVLIITGCAAGCGKTGSKSASSTSAKAVTGTIDVISRESGSGTRGAFIELFGIETKNSDGSKTDNTYSGATVANSTGVVLTDVSGDERAIGYISLGSLSSKVKALKIDGVSATAANIKNGTYKIARPFNIVTKSNLNAQSKDFISFILSAQGQKIVSDNGYIPLDNTSEYKASGASGKITVAGSSSVTPVMEKLAEAYEKLNVKIDVEVQESDSTTGISSAASGVCDIGMASRELTDSEKAQGVTPTVIATDGIAVIVNNSNSLEGLTSAQVLSIFEGKTTSWENV